MHGSADKNKTHGSCAFIETTCLNQKGVAVDHTEARSKFCLSPQESTSSQASCRSYEAAVPHSECRHRDAIYQRAVENITAQQNFSEAKNLQSHNAPSEADSVKCRIVNIFIDTS